MQKHVRTLINRTRFFIIALIMVSAFTACSSPLEGAGAKPPAPAKPALTAGNGSLAVNWERADMVDSYRVYCGTSQTPPAEPVQSGITGTSTSITGLINDTAYYVWVQAVNERGASPLSEASSKILSLQAPAAPNLIAGNGSLAVSWEAADLADSYNVYYGTEETPPASPAQTGITGTSASITGLVNGTTYYVWIEAVNAGGTKLGTSSSKSLTLAAPTGVLAEITSQSSITVSWNLVTDATGYYIYRSSSASGTYTQFSASTDTFYINTGLDSGTTYYYKVSAYNTSAESAQSAAVSATTQIGTSITITLAAQNDVGISTQSASIPRGQSRIFQVMGSYTSYQWYLNGDAITGAAAASYMLNTASMKLGVYELAVMVSTGEGARLSGACRVRVE